ncbi:hypothetical protein [Paraburkholderia flagellata]|uniref:hypothetical protein n=1 Tax=Paraburkholderia flagellata TaxID=2883241 RepID=UPI001F41F2AC|nr:hypothetical protein [Paraburkholderia flagellata]
MTKCSSEKQTETVAETCRRVGISRKQAHEWKKLAEVPEAEFEAMLKAPDMKARYNAIIKAPVGGHGRLARPAMRLLDSMLALELEIGAFDATALDDLDAQQRAALDRVASSLLASLHGLRAAQGGQS